MARGAEPALLRAGTARRSGRGIALVLEAGTFYVTEEELAHLASGGNATVVNGQGEGEGYAWLSPVLAARKRELMVLVDDRLFCIGTRHVAALLQRERNAVPVREYRGHAGDVLPRGGNRTGKSCVSCPLRR